MRINSNIATPVPTPFTRRCLATLGLVVLTGGLAGCETLAITALGLGASAGVSHQTEGISYRTFTAPSKKVRGASLVALNKMGIAVETTGKTDSGEIIKAATADYAIEIELEAISPTATRMRAVAKRSLFVYDAATAREIIAQTERALGKA
jgi:hypothetical protein